MPHATSMLHETCYMVHTFYIVSVCSAGIVGSVNSRNSLSVTRSVCGIGLLRSELFTVGSESLLGITSPFSSCISMIRIV